MASLVWCPANTTLIDPTTSPTTFAPSLAGPAVSFLPPLRHINTPLLASHAVATLEHHASPHIAHTRLSSPPARYHANMTAHSPEMHSPGAHPERPKGAHLPLALTE
jgi:hypothetical protein